MTHEELELTDIRDFTTVLRDFEMQVLRMVTVAYRE